MSKDMTKEELLEQLMIVASFLKEEKKFRKELEEFDEDSGLICYRLYHLLRSITAYSVQLAINSLSEGDEKAAERLMAVNNMIYAQSPVELFSDTPRGTRQKACFATGKEKSRENIVIINEQTGKVFTTSEKCPEHDEMPADIMEDIFGPVHKIEKGRDEDKSNEETKQEEDLVAFHSRLSKEIEDLEKYPKIHPTQKPVALLEFLIKTFTDVDDVVIDCCAGSGTTLVAAGNLNRKAYGFEIKKEFVKGFYDQLFPLIQPDLFVQEEKREKDEKVKQLYLFA